MQDIEPQSDTETGGGKERDRVSKETHAEARVRNIKRGRKSDKEGDTDIGRKRDKERDI